MASGGSNATNAPLPPPPPCSELKAHVGCDAYPCYDPTTDLRIDIILGISCIITSGFFLFYASVIFKYMQLARHKVHDERAKLGIHFLEPHNPADEEDKIDSFDHALDSASDDNDDTSTQDDSSEHFDDYDDDDLSRIASDATSAHSHHRQHPAASSANLHMSEQDSHVDSGGGGPTTSSE